MNRNRIAILAIVIAGIGLIGLFGMWLFSKPSATVSGSPDNKFSVKELNPYQYDISISKDKIWHDTGIWIGDKIQEIRIWTIPNNPRQPFIVKIGNQEFKSKLVTNKSMSVFFIKVEVGENGLHLESEQKIFLMVDEAAQAAELRLKVEMSDTITKDDFSPEEIYTWQGDVLGNATWYQTGIWMKKNEILQVKASGNVMWWTAPPNGLFSGDVGPDGCALTPVQIWNQLNRPEVANRFPMPSANGGALIMMIGTKKYKAGSSATIKAEEDGFVMFQVNDEHVEDNTGAFHVEVKK
jgi:hypothetical protein